ncbi:hypothetical protein BH11ACT4_BH11ACT4_23630 [soil metagenome]
MSDVPTQQLPEPNRHPVTPGGGGRPWLIVLAVVLGLAVIALVIVLVVRGSGAPGPAPSSPSPSASPSQSPSPSSTPTQTSAPAVTACAGASLAISLGTPNGAAGSTYLPVVFANSGAQPCTLRGYPVVSFVDAAGTTIGAAAAPDTSKPQSDNTLQPGASISAVLRITSAGNVDNCSPQDAVGLKVQPPDVGTAVTLNASGYTACANSSTNILSIAPIAAG